MYMKLQILSLLLLFNSVTVQALEPEPEPMSVPVPVPEESAYTEDTNYLRNRIDKAISQQKDHISLLQYRENYLVYSYFLNGVNQQPVDSAFPNEEHSFLDYEMQFQFSFMVPIALNIFDIPLSVYGAYTNRSFWQLFDKEDSRPFRETNHEPEIWLAWDYDLSWGDLKAPMIWFGFRHQSNGQYVNMSRGWNRIYTQAFFGYKHWSSSAIFWHRLKGGSPEDKRFDYEKFIGSGELRLDYTFQKSELGMIYAYSFSGFDFGSVTLQYSHAMSNAVDFYVRYFDGYGESLIDIEYISQTISVGILLNEW